MSGTVGRSVLWESTYVADRIEPQAPCWARLAALEEAAWCPLTVGPWRDH